MNPNTSSDIYSLDLCYALFFQKLLYEERETKEHEKTTRKKLLHDCRILYDQLQGCNGNLSSEDNFIVNSSLGDALDFLTTSDDQIDHLLAEVLSISWLFLIAKQIYQAHTHTLILAKQNLHCLVCSCHYLKMIPRHDHLYLEAHFEYKSKGRFHQFLLYDLPTTFPPKLLFRHSYYLKMIK